MGLIMIYYPLLLYTHVAVARKLTSHLYHHHYPLSLNRVVYSIYLRKRILYLFFILVCLLLLFHISEHTFTLQNQHHIKYIQLSDCRGFFPLFLSVHDQKEASNSLPHHNNMRGKYWNTHTLTSSSSTWRDTDEQKGRVIRMVFCCCFSSSSFSCHLNHLLFLDVLQYCSYTTTMSVLEDMMMIRVQMKSCVTTKGMLQGEYTVVVVFL